MFVGNNVLKTFCHFLETRIDFADFQFFEKLSQDFGCADRCFHFMCEHKETHFRFSKMFRRKLMFPFVCMANKSKLPKLFSMDDQLDAANSLFDRYLMHNECYKLCKQDFPNIFYIAIGNYKHPFTL